MSDAVFYTLVFLMLAAVLGIIVGMYLHGERKYGARAARADNDAAEMLRLQRDILEALRALGWQDNRRIDVHVQQPRPNGSIQHR